MRGRLRSPDVGRYLAAFTVSACLTGCGGGGADVIDLGPPRQLLYVSDDLLQLKHGGGLVAGRVHVFDAETLARVGTFEGGDGLASIHATPDGAMLWMVAEREGTVTLLDTTTYEEFELDVGTTPSHSSISPWRDQIWVANDGSDDVAVIDLPTRTVVNRLVTGAGHHELAMVPDAAGRLVRVYVSNLLDGTVTPVLANGTVLSPVVGTGPAPRGMDYSSLTQRVYNCSGDATNSIEVIATKDETATAGDETDTVVARIPLASRCTYLHVSDDGQFAYATLPGADAFVRVRLSDHLVDSFPTGTSPDRFEVVSRYAYVGNVAEATVTVVDLTGVTASRTVDVGRAVAPTASIGRRAVRFDHHRGRVFVTNEYDGTVTVLSVVNQSVVGTLVGMHAPTGVSVGGPSYGTTFPR